MHLSRCMVSKEECCWGVRLLSVAPAQQRRGLRHLSVSCVCVVLRAVGWLGQTLAAGQAVDWAHCQHGLLLCAPLVSLSSEVVHGLVLPVHEEMHRGRTCVWLKARLCAVACPFLCLQLAGQHLPDTRQQCDTLVTCEHRGVSYVRGAWWTGLIPQGCSKHPSSTSSATGACSVGVTCCHAA